MGAADFEATQRRRARWAGLVYLGIIACATPSQAILRSVFVVEGDAAATAANVLASESLFRFAVSIDLVAHVLDLVLAALVFRLLEPVDRTWARLAASFWVVQAAILGVNLTHLATVWLILDDGVYLSAFAPDQRDALVLLALRAHTYGYLISMVFFGCGVAVLGRLFWRSGYLPRGLAAAYGGGGAWLVAGILALFLFPDTVRPWVGAFLLPDALAEWTLCGWLLVRGVRVPDLR